MYHHNKTVVIVGAFPQSLINFRGDLIAQLISRGNKVIACASGATSQEIQNIESLGASYKDYAIQRNGFNPISDLKTLIALYRIFKQIKPDIFLGYTVKPVVWGGLAARLAQVKHRYAMITGLGYAFQKTGIVRGILRLLVKGLYRISLNGAHGVIFQNPDNQNLFIEERLVDENKCSVVNGSGVNITRFQRTDVPCTPRFLLVARLLKEKGIREFAQAAKAIKSEHPEVEFHLVGPVDPSPDAIGLHEVEGWQKSNILHYHGGVDDVRPYMEKCSVFVLPSYHEGMPRTVLEAMAIGRPILTTDVEGCKETVVDGINGFLIEKGSAAQLVTKMKWFIDNPDSWQSMGDQSYHYATEKFDVEKVNADILKILGIG